MGGEQHGHDEHAARDETLHAYAHHHSRPARGVMANLDEHDHDHDEHAARDEVLHAHAHHHARPARGFYRPAHRLLQWGEVQKGMHAAWGDLFYDLIMVGAAFRTGDFLKENIDYDVGPLVVAGCGITWLSSWSHLLQYRCRFSAKSLAHKLVDLLEGLSAAAAAHNIVSDKASFEAYYMYEFLFWVLVSRAVQAGRMLELVLLPEADKECEGSARYAAADMLARLVAECATLSLGFLASSTEGMMAALLGTWLFQKLLFVLPILLVTGRAAARALRSPPRRAHTPRALRSPRLSAPRAQGWLHKEHLVPIHVEYTVRRMGEMVMLMLGEGVLSLVLSETKLATQEEGGKLCGTFCWRGKGKAAISFSAGFLLMFSLNYSYYRSNRFARHHHAVRRSAVRGILWNLSHYPLALSMISAGVCIKAIQPYADSGEVDRAYVRTSASCVCFSLLANCAQQVLHPGLDAFWHAPQMRAKRLGLFAAKVLLALGCLLSPAFPDGTEGYAYMLHVSLLACASALLVSLEKSPKIDHGLWYYVDHAVPDSGLYHDPAIDQAAAAGAEADALGGRGQKHGRARRQASHGHLQGQGHGEVPLVRGTPSAERAEDFERQQLRPDHELQDAGKPPRGPSAPHAAHADQVVIEMGGGRGGAAQPAPQLHDEPQPPPRIVGGGLSGSSVPRIGGGGLSGSSLPRIPGGGLSSSSSVPRSVLRQRSFGRAELSFDGGQRGVRVAQLSGDEGGGSSRSVSGSDGGGSDADSEADSDGSASSAGSRQSGRRRAPRRNDAKTVEEDINTAVVLLA